MTTADALALDAQDVLAPFRAEFAIDDPSLIYLDGNSLGRMPLRAASLLMQAAEAQWGSRLVRAWGEEWIHKPRQLGDKIAKLIGAEPGEVLVADSTSVNFYKLVATALEAKPGRTKIVTDDLNFPSDLYILQGLVRTLGGKHEISRVASPDGLTPGDIASQLDSTAALLTLSHTAFKSGYVHDMAELTAAAHAAGAFVLWDLSHSVGAMPLDVKAANADFAVGCTYKYLNGGPGAPAFLYVRKNLQEKLTSPICGWFGQDQPFDLALDYRSAPGINRFMAGTPPMLSMIAIEAGVDLLLEAGMDRIRAKSVAQTGFLISLWETHLAPLGVTLNSPRDASLRGSHVSLGHAEALRIDQALIEEMNVIPDFRYPDNIRFGVAPLYTSFVEIEEAVMRFRRVLDEGIHLKYSVEKPTVT